MTLIATLIGLSFTLFCGVAIVINCIVLHAMFKARYPCINPLYILTAFTIGTCTLRMTVIGFYYAPQIIFERTLLGENDTDQVPFLITSFIVVMWAEAAFTQVLIALNRVFTMRDMPQKRWFSKRNCLIYIVIIIPQTAVVLWISYSLLPCCKYYFFRHLYSVWPLIIDGQANMIMDYVFRPLNILCYSLPVVCYVMIFAQVYTATREQQSGSSAERRREVARTLHFAYAFIFYLGLYISLELQPYIPKSMPVLNVFEIYLAICDCVSMAVIQATMNKNIRRNIKWKPSQWVNRVKPSQSSQIGVTWIEPTSLKY
ncbi:Serpentine Receptor, class X [Ditylenchus destructor]|uniref:Serpentine Receptor, class X n=1 Tax=Ditylenchus destructor TaxID=166010 RepID=A0AAD4QVA2_9BILA|nr:Serpentine Receptor, class X [Ditylenchus destructor]